MTGRALQTPLEVVTASRKSEKNDYSFFLLEGPCVEKVAPEKGRPVLIARCDFLLKGLLPGTGAHRTTLRPLITIKKGHRVVCCRPRLL
ncbi:hypothetical protein CDAR_457211 [Caerostris darwini]|uniref:Uncharacterized protein n=1 Tax=Caerostris darwini TaxID=1538125 RepID=A0AAV4PB58_9ARAC|nr:hypothetical protein CDAR_457211 [Caerostris darwini]